MNIGDILIWGLRLILIGVCLYGLWIRSGPIFLIGFSGLGGSILGWGLTTMLLEDPLSGFFGVLLGLAMVLAGNWRYLLMRWSRRKGHWIVINGQKIWIPPGAREVDVYIEILRNPENPAIKVEKSVAKKKDEKDEDYKERMR